MEKKGWWEQFIDNSFETVFSKDKTVLIIISLLVLAFFLRLIAAINVSVAADDMHFTVHAINFLSSGKLVVYDQSASLWYYLTDIFYNLIGTSQLGSRSVSLIFGSFSILVIFLLAREFFDTKTATIAAVLLSLSVFHIKNTIAEMDILVTFFIFLSLYVLMLGAKSSKSHLMAVSGIIFGLAIFTKVYSLLFLPVLVIFFLYKSKITKLNKKGRNLAYKKIFVFLAVAFIFAIPSLTHNYLLYKDKGITDFLYANTLGIAPEENSQIYSWDAGWGHGADFKGFFLGNSFHMGGEGLPTAILPLQFIFFSDPLIVILGLIGLVICFRKNKDYFILTSLIFVFVYIFLASRILLSKHYVFVLFSLILPASFSINLLLSKIKSNKKAFYSILFILLFIVSLFQLGYPTKYTLTHFYTPSEVQQLMSFMDDIPDNSLVVADSRIYRGQIHWTLNEKTYLEASLLNELISLSDSLPGDKLPFQVYFVECVPDDCGWGTIKDQPEFNASMEEIVSQFAEAGTLIKTIEKADPSKSYWPGFGEKKDHFNVYKSTILLNPNSLNAIKSTKNWFLYPIGYDESIQPIFDKYQTHSLLDSLLDLLAHVIVYISIILSFASLLLTIYLLINKNENSEHNSTSL